MSRFVLQPKYNGVMTVSSNMVEPTTCDKSFDEEVSFYQCNEESMCYNAEPRLRWSTKVELPGGLKQPLLVECLPENDSRVAVHPCPTPSFKANRTQTVSRGMPGWLRRKSTIFVCSDCMFDTRVNGCALNTEIDRKLSQGNTPKTLLLPEL
jgi:hypothetical protein